MKRSSADKGKKIAKYIGLGVLGVLAVIGAIGVITAIAGAVNGVGFIDQYNTWFGSVAEDAETVVETAKLLIAG